LLTFYPCSIRKKTSLTRLVLGRTHQPLVPHELGSSWTSIRWIKGDMLLRCPKPLEVHFAPYVLNKLIQCFFKFLRPNSCNSPNWHLQWVVGMIMLGVGLIFIIYSVNYVVFMSNRQQLQIIRGIAYYL